MIHTGVNGNESFLKCLSCGYEQIGDRYVVAVGVTCNKCHHRVFVITPPTRKITTPLTIMYGPQIIVMIDNKTPL